jgi:hypothetical protein
MYENKVGRELCAEIAIFNYLKEKTKQQYLDLGIHFLSL